MSSNGLLQDKLALITGAASGIGRAICQVFAREGARIAAVDINEEGMVETLKLCAGEGHFVFKTDVSKSIEVSSLFEEILAKFGNPVSILVNCAGILTLAPFLEMTEEQYDTIMDVNMKSQFLMMQQGAKQMIAHKVSGGNIVNISSSAAKKAEAILGHYCASKAGGLSLSRTAALELAPHGIRCNVVLPSGITTPMSTSISDLYPEAAQAYIKTVPLARPGQPEEVAECCLFLASEKSSYMTGASVDVNGGVLM